jgi:alkylated DNA repair dioxygenase AlkB
VAGPKGASALGPMSSAPGFVLQGSLLAQGPPQPDGSFGGLERLDLGAGAWIDHQPGWLGGSDDLLGEVVERMPWRQRERPMYERLLPEPRLTAWLDVGVPGLPSPFPEVAQLLGHRYGRPIRTVGFNWYRDGRDSVAWHGDRVPRPGDALVAIVSIGARRPFLLRPHGGGPSRRCEFGRGDLLVMGGTCQATWQHTVPKVASAGPRISVTFRD